MGVEARGSELLTGALRTEFWCLCESSRRSVDRLTLVRVWRRVEPSWKIMWKMIFHVAPLLYCTRQNISDVCGPCKLIFFSKFFFCNRAMICNGHDREPIAAFVMRPIRAHLAGGTSFAFGREMRFVEACVRFAAHTIKTEHAHDAPKAPGGRDARDGERSAVRQPSRARRSDSGCADCGAALTTGAGRPHVFSSCRPRSA